MRWGVTPCLAVDWAAAIAGRRRGAASANVLAATAAEETAWVLRFPPSERSETGFLIAW
jgi:hypothetical protein